MNPHFYHNHNNNTKKASPRNNHHLRNHNNNNNASLQNSNNASRQNSNNIIIPMTGLFIAIAAAGWLRALRPPKKDSETVLIERIAAIQRSILTTRCFSHEQLQQIKACYNCEMDILTEMQQKKNLNLFFTMSDTSLKAYLRKLFEKACRAEENVC